jgi:hypothetical protein
MRFSRKRMLLAAVGVLGVALLLGWWFWPRPAPGMVDQGRPTSSTKTAPTPVDAEGNPLPVPPAFSGLTFLQPPAGIPRLPALPGPPKDPNDKRYLDLRNAPPPPPLPDNFPGVPPPPPLLRKPQPGLLK